MARQPIWLGTMPGIIYLIGCDGPERYVGHTICKLNIRWNLHKSKYRKWVAEERPNWKSGLVYYASFQLFDKYGLEGCWIDVLEEVSDDTLLKERERHWIENTSGCVNRCMPGRTRKETCAAWYASLTPEEKELRMEKQRSYRARLKDAKLKAEPSV